MNPGQLFATLQKWIKPAGRLASATGKSFIVGKQRNRLKKYLVSTNLGSGDCIPLFANYVLQIEIFCVGGCRKIV